MTPLGRKIAIDWLRDMLAEPQNEFPEFPVAHLVSRPGDAGGNRRAARSTPGFLGGREKKLAADLETYLAQLPRVLLLENEYALAVTRAERQWVEASSPTSAPARSTGAGDAAADLASARGRAPDKPG